MIAALIVIGLSKAGVGQDVVVLDAGCGPLVGATVTLWHTDARGRYGPRTGDCYYGGTVRSDRNGRFPAGVQSISPQQGDRYWPTR